MLRVMPMNVSQPNNTVFICFSPLGDSVVGLARWVSMVFGGFSVWCLLWVLWEKIFLCELLGIGVTFACLLLCVVYLWGWVCFCW